MTCAREGCENEVMRKRRDAKWCSDRCRKRVCEERNRATCGNCGRPMALGSAWHSRSNMQCRVCADADKAAQHEATLSTVERLWIEGRSYREIAAGIGRQRVDYTGVISMLLDELFKAGRIEPRRKGYIPEARAARDEVIVRLYDEGVPLRDLAVKVGLRPRGLDEILARLHGEGRIGYRQTWRAAA